MTEQLHFYFSLSCIGEGNGEGNGSPLQCSCLENPRGGGAWWPDPSPIFHRKEIWCSFLKISFLCGFRVAYSNKSRFYNVQKAPSSFVPEAAVV